MHSELDALIAETMLRLLGAPSDQVAGILSNLVLADRKTRAREASTQSTGGSEAVASIEIFDGHGTMYVEEGAFKLPDGKYDLYTSPPGGSEAVEVKAPIRGPTYYTEGKDADWFEQLDDTEFAKRASYAAMDIVDGDFARIEDYIPVVAILGGAADRIRRLLAAAPPEGIAARDAVIEEVRPLIEAAEGLSYGEDWNNGTQAKLHGYRQKLLDALPRALRALRSPASSKDGNHA